MTTWGFALEEISFPKLYLWHGERDNQIALEQAQNIAERLAHCKATYYPEEGQISTIVDHQDEIVTTLIS